MESQKRIILISLDPDLIKSFTASCEARGTLPECVESIQEAWENWTRPDSTLLGVIADAAMMSPEERNSLANLHKPEQAPKLVQLDGAVTESTSGKYVERVRWPLSAPFIEKARLHASQPMVFLANTTLYSTGLLQAVLNQAG